MENIVTNYKHWFYIQCAQGNNAVSDIRPLHLPASRFKISAMQAASLLYTDQASCYDASGNEIDCRQTGQDGEFNRQRPVDADRFKTIDDVVEDRWTGLCWHRNANFPGFPRTWSEGFDFIKEMNREGVGDRATWRLPSRQELFSLISHQHINPALPSGHPFDQVFNGYYWTRTETKRLPDQAWYVHLGGGRIYRGMKHGSYLIWPVSGNPPAQPSGQGRFVAADNVLHDRWTRRAWLLANGIDDHPLTWQAVWGRLAQINAMNTGGYNDWRVPNIRELDSLVDLTTHSPAIAGQADGALNREGYWSATTSLYEPRYAWVLYTKDGAIGVGYKRHPDFYLAAVR